jgi:Flp pilus assembly protein TadG
MLRLRTLEFDSAAVKERVTHGLRKMLTGGKRSFKEAVSEEHGQMIVMAAFTMILFLGICAWAVDVGYALVVKNKLQASADAAALAAAQHLDDGTWHSVGMNYTSQSGSLNSYSGFTTGTPSVTAECSTTVEGWGIPFDPSEPNVVQVVESGTWPTFFAWIVGHPTMTVNVESEASKGTKAHPYNVAIILDTTYSMRTPDPNCPYVNGQEQTQLQCAETAIGVILGGLDPSVDNISLFTFPAMEQNSTSNDTNCSGQQATGEPYTFPSATATSMQTVRFTGGSGTVQTTYQIAGFANDYRSSDSAKSLNSSSSLTKAVGLSSGCSGLQVNSTQNTYFASTIYAAQSALLAEQAANPGTSNTMILLSDGNATAVNNNYWKDMATSSQSNPGVNNSADGLYPNLQGECGQAVDAANAASAAGTLVFTIAYGSPSTSTGGGRYGNGGNCASDVGTGAHPNITPCEDMQDMSTGWPTDTSHFYSDYYAPGGDSGCQAAGKNNTITNLSDIAASIVVALRKERLIPPNTP